jgi:hypothetical protein
VARLSGCLATIRPGQRRVLVLRAGIGAADPHSRAAVADRLDLRLRTVRRTERRGIRALRAAARVGCSAASGGSSGSERTAETVAFHLGANRDERGGGAAGTATGRADEPGQSGVKEEFRSGPGGAPGATLTPPSLGDGDGTPPPVAMLLALAFLAGFAAVWTLERRRA